MPQLLLQGFPDGAIRIGCFLPVPSGGCYGPDAALSELTVILRWFPSVGRPPLFHRPSNAGLSDAILSGVTNS